MITVKRTDRQEVGPAVAESASAVLEARGLVAHHGSNRVVSGVSLRIEPGEFVTLLGPSGCGKTTTLRCVAGLHRIDGGTISIGGRTVAGPREHIPPERRSVNMVFQSYALWPHMTVFQNVAYGLKAQRLPRREVATRTEEMLDLVGLSGYGPRPATSLSGGQQQRVVLARGLVTQPTLLLLDEPLSNLDTELRVRMRTEIHALQRRLKLTMLYVTHDRTEALALSDRVVVMRHGVVQQEGKPDELYARPVNRFVAEALGPVNVLPGTFVTTETEPAVALKSAEGAPALRVAAGPQGAAGAAGQEVDVLIRPESLTLRAPGSEADGIPAVVELVEYLGNRTEVTCRSGEAIVKVELARRPGGIRAGDAVTVALDEDGDGLLPTWQPRGQE
jgi:ABC-type Fe3+/spermidine/putrescine transport system ATPase subunit